MREPVLVIMAAGMGSRFGGLKQITPVDDEQQKIIDYTLYDAKRAGFKKVVFIIKKAIDKDFREAMGTEIEKHFDVRYVYQEVDKLPEGFSVPEGREKPWGTGHAILCAKDSIDGPFAVVNSDDYYGANSIKKIYDFLLEERPDNEHAMVGYLVKNTVTENGSVSRGVCEVENGLLTSIVERTKIFKKGDDATYTEDGETFVDMPGDTYISMNLWGFQQAILDDFEKGFPMFLSDNIEKNPLKCEYVLPNIPNAQIQEKRGTVAVLPTEDKWHGVTYSADLQSVKDAIADMKKDGLYPQTLWA